MSKLYIIGNGFDQHHNIKTNYADFRNYLKTNYSDLFDSMESYYDMDEDSLLWSQFENGLKDFNPTELEANFGKYIPDYSSDDFKEGNRSDLQFYIKNELEPIQEELQKAFNSWIASRRMLSSIYSRKIQLDSNALFLNFNYTDILESLYCIPRNKINYIHNKSGENNSNLLFGHAWNPTEWAKQREHVMPENLEDEEKQDWIDYQSENHDYSIMIAYEEIDNFFSKIYKDCNTVIQNNISFFQQLKSITEIYIFGHSLSEVDRPYFIKIVQSVKLKDVHWIISYYGNDELNSHTNFITEVGVDLSMVKFIKLDELLVNF